MERTTNFYLIREMNSQTCCIGKLILPSGKSLRTLEPPYRGQLAKNKIKGRTAIPYGNYTMKEYLSPKFKEFLPLLEDVPNFEAVEIHVGNYPHNTSGCILVGKMCCYTTQEVAGVRQFIDGQVLRSREAMTELMAEFTPAAREGTVVLNISLAKECVAVCDL